MGKVEERIADFIVNTPASEVPAAAIASAHRSALDCVGCVLAASVEPQGRTIAGFARAEGGHDGPASVIGGPLRTSRSMAALANGTLAHGLDYDDGRTSTGHASGMLLPAALAIAEPVGASGRDLLTAYAIGLEVITHIGDACDFEQKEGGFHRTSLFGTMAATATAARLLGLDVRQTMMAMGTAGAVSGGLCQSFGTFTKPLHSGMAAKNAVTAALLAAEGWTGSEDILGGPAGWAKAFIRHYRYDAMASGLGTEWRTATRTPLIKEFPCCGLIHGPATSLLTLIREHGFTAGDVAEVRVSAPYDSMVLMYPNPASGYQGKFSLPYAVATILIDGRLDLDSFDDAKLSRPEYAETAAKIRINVTSQWEGTMRGERRAKADDRLPVIVKLRDGRELRQSTERVRGLDTDALVAEKFRRNAARALPPGAVEAALAAWSGLDTARDVREVVASVTTGALIPAA
ncbi:MmgE/PrpD family protein [Amaricoccus solimangrovi]|uniref:MmgE/PrpD family protein n=1 Tax=Amaricoccus solimangrovi TaxID=2589815 RepID=A0A501WB14_9RHOB|nr:MmgE/PrpD family protein [Amaricoccus solimangrovi]TPE47123.1 MmgE/PrpD family protein [Amaricoccus solimangrovi]